jgi:septation ring formation regulator EzrA
MAWAAEGDPAPPQSLPIIYDQPGGKFILRVDNRRYQLANENKEAVARFIADANYVHTKNLFDALKRALIDKAKADDTVKRADTIANRESARVERLRQTLESLRAQSLSVRTSPYVDLVTLTRIDNEILNTSAQLHNAEDQADKAKDKATEVRKAAEPAQQAAQKAQDDYATALKQYEKTLADLKALAIATGSAL